MDSFDLWDASITFQYPVVIDIKMVLYGKIYCIPLEKGTQMSCRHNLIKHEST